VETISAKYCLKRGAGVLALLMFDKMQIAGRSGETTHGRFKKRLFKSF
jgi:hypothetical protein